MGPHLALEGAALARSSSRLRVSLPLHLLVKVGH
jgi:hypothetical protein